MSDSFFDTNILVYAFDLDEPEKQSIAKTLIKQKLKELQPSHISNQVLGELSNALAQKIQTPYSPTQIQEILHGFSTSRWTIHTYSIATINSALDLLAKAKNNLSFWDALIAATMLENQVYQIYTEDPAFSKILGIKAVNPFKKRK